MWVIIYSCYDAIHLGANHLSKLNTNYRISCACVACHYMKIRLAVITALELWPHDDVVKWKHFPRYWPFVRGIHPSPVNSPHEGQWRGALMFSLRGWVNNREAGDLRHHQAHFDVIATLLQYDSIKSHATSFVHTKHNQCPHFAQSTIVSLPRSVQNVKTIGQLLLTWFNFNPSMDK